MFRRCLLGGGEELEEGRVGVTTGLTRGALSVSGGVAPPRLEGSEQNKKQKISPQAAVEDAGTSLKPGQNKNLNLFTTY